jgi:hypothetical protein
MKSKLHCRNVSSVKANGNQFDMQMQTVSVAVSASGAEKHSKTAVVRKSVRP